MIFFLLRKIRANSLLERTRRKWKTISRHTENNKMVQKPKTRPPSGFPAPKKLEKKSLTSFTVKTHMET